MNRVQYGVMLFGMNGCIIPNFKTEEDAVLYGYSRKIGFVVMRQTKKVSPDGTVTGYAWKSVGMDWSVEQANEYLNTVAAHPRVDPTEIELQINAKRAADG